MYSNSPIVPGAGVPLQLAAESGTSDQLRRCRSLPGTTVSRPRAALPKCRSADFRHFQHDITTLNSSGRDSQEPSRILSRTPDAMSDAPPLDMLTFVYNPATHAVVLYNDCYGGFGFSKWFGEEFTDTFGPHEENADYTDNSRVASLHVLATIQRIGSFKACSAGYSQIACALVPRAAVRCVVVHEYDGMESVGIDCERYLRYMMDEKVQTEAVDATMWLAMKEEAENLRVVTGVETTENFKTFITFPRLVRGPDGAYYPAYDSVTTPCDTMSGNSSDDGNDGSDSL